MDTYKQKSWWKILLMIIGMIIIVFTMFYTNYLSKRLAESEKKYIEFYTQAVQRISESIKSDNIELQQQDQSLELLITTNVKNPIVVDWGDGDLGGYNWGEEKENDQKFLAAQLKKIKKSGIPPIVPLADEDPETPDPQYPRIYYKYSKLYTLITWFPLIQVFLISIFVLFGYLIFSSMRRAEQNRVWVGMSKETAHQLGTPISGIMGWVEYLKSATNPNNDQQEALSELEKDVKKLDLIADRFSKIGSKPALKKQDINELIDNTVTYLKKRSPKNIRYIFDHSGNIEALVNNHLFSWVIENILRNALDAMDDKGTIKLETKTEGNKIIIDISDTGKGISSGKLKTVFKPGYSTKKRGWGLGLSLAKRIIREYHKGKIFVLKSKVNEGTTFRIILPKA
jgi:two-component sensor histidine kinase